MRASRDERLAAAQSETGAVVNSIGVAKVREIGPTPTVESEVLIPSPTAEELQQATLTATPILGEVYEGYGTKRIVGRFSNYWPPYGGTNCFSDCEQLADGNRVDQAIAEGWKVVACPREIILGTRIEYPPGSGLIWTCRDYGDDIFLYYGESGLPIYWFDFMSPDAWVDYGSYIQVDIHVPCGQVDGIDGC